MSFYIKKVGDKMKDINELVDESGILLTSSVMAEGISKQRLYSFIKKNNFEKVGHGVYASQTAWVDENYILSLRCPNAVFSHEEALYYYGLIDHEPTKQTITIYTGYGTGKLVEDGICVYTIKKELINLGKIIVINSYGHEIPIYNLEITICDLVRNRNEFEIQDFQTAMKSYVLKKDKNLNLLMEYAKQFRIEKKIRDYLEVLL